MLTKAIFDYFMTCPKFRQIKVPEQKLVFQNMEVSKQYCILWQNLGNCIKSVPTPWEWFKLQVFASNFATNPVVSSALRSKHAQFWKNAVFYPTSNGCSSRTSACIWKLKTANWTPIQPLIWVKKLPWSDKNSHGFH